MKLKSNKKGIAGDLVKIILVVVFLLAVMLIFFGDGLLSEASAKIRRVIKDIPEKDQTTGELDFFRNNDLQLKFLTNWHSDMAAALLDSNANSNGGCIMDLASLEYEGFYKPGSNYNLYLTQSGTNIEMTMTRYASQDYENSKDKKEVPVTKTNIENAKLCIIEGQSALAFYDEFNEISPGEVPDLKKVTPVTVNTIMISSGQQEKTKRKIGYHKTAKPQDENDYTWETLFRKKGDRTIIYAVRLDYNGEKYLCLFPTYNDKLDVFNGCGKPKNGLIQTDCFDSDSDKHSLKYNFENPKGSPLIPSTYLCSDKMPVIPAVAPNTALNP